MESWQNVYPVSGNAVARELDDWRIWFCVRAERLSAGDGLCDADLFYPGDYSGAVDAPVCYGAVGGHGGRL